MKWNGYSIKKEALDVLKNYSFPGNVRELQNLLNKAMFEADEKIINLDDIDRALKMKKEDRISYFFREFERGKNFWDTVKREFLAKDLNRLEVKEIIRRALSKTEKGSYKEVLKLFNLKEDDYHKFMAFLHKYKIIDKK